ncbi:CAP domain-containing protein, partial [Flavobacteriales bacterium]|nr:CAP domain-containing protein [Flavobacteriales bacterium]
HTSYSKKYIKSLKRDLANQAPLLPLNHQQNLHLFAKHHSKTTGKAGKTGHQSVGFKNYTKRIKKLIKIYSYLGENIHYGSTDAKEIVIDLLIDDGIKNLGHRKNILSNTFIYVSTSIQPHKKYGQNCVIEFGGSLN